MTGCLMPKSAVSAVEIVGAIAIHRRRRGDWREVRGRKEAVLECTSDVRHVMHPRASLNATPHRRGQLPATEYIVIATLFLDGLKLDAKSESEGNQRGSSVHLRSKEREKKDGYLYDSELTERK
jgi:hypothetical protein